MKRFSSIHEMATQVERSSYSKAASAWNSWVDTPTAIARARRGSDRYLVKQVDKLVDRMDRIRPINSRQWERGFAGSFPDVPSAVMGLPASMWQRPAAELGSAPIRLVFEVARSSNLDTRTIIERGAAAAALALRLSETRAVDFLAGWCLEVNGQRYCGCVPVPLGSLAHTTYLLADPAFARNLMLVSVRAHIGDRRSVDDLWLAWFHAPDREEQMRQAFGLGSQDIFVEGADKPFSLAETAKALSRL